ncbi:hypothetical protein AURDEDRAFT_186930 [Auricularia subglabra TFB-10046 SS5]|nr:hypothetical protein AURDEDRAFT_186930 [Auricularia subglabra TFB-10046 SS5]
MPPESDILKDAARAYIGPIASAHRRDSTAEDDLPQIPCMQGVKEHALQVVAQEIARCMQEMNAQNSAASLPSELLADVFSHLSVQDRFSASEVCSRWRLAATRFAHTWTDLDEFGVISPRLAVAIERTGSLPFRLGFVLELPPSLRTRPASAALRSVLAHLSRCSYRLVSLRVTLLSAWATLPILLDALKEPAPMLAELSLNAVHESGDCPTLRTDLFAGEAPKLTRLRLRHVFLPERRIPALRRITFLHLKSRTTRPRHDLTALIGLPSLLKYELDLPTTYCSNAISASLAADSKLQVVRFLSPCKSPIVTLRPYALCPHISMVEVPSPAIASIWEEARACPTRLIVLRLDGRTFVGGQNDAGITRLFRDTNDYTHTAELVTHAALHLRVLVMDTGRWKDQDPTVLSLPALRLLHIVIRPTGGSFPERSLLPLWLQAPELRTLRITFEDCTPDSPTIQLEEQLEKFMACVGCRAPVFLELRGAELLHIPDGLLPSTSACSSDMFSADQVDGYGCWDDWLADSLAQMEEL